MNSENGRQVAAFGAIASGSSGQWDVAVDESLDGTEWTLEIEGPRTYLVFQLRDAQVVSEAARFLQPPPSGRDGQQIASRRELVAGRFGSAPVSIVWDDEGFVRCFLVIGPRDACSLRLSLDAEDIRALGEALNQVLEDMLQAVRE